ncbi:hypothetical protein IU500_24760 [Nocardia terpenica]|uniref:alpha/beta hydrolase n=1 Tax=Nocardia terpenica TaxID=455432 RepID=UPI0018937504|nr:alpha/beta hydrolase [Nocardia terpenica]MBF6064714.1 hypothetical protein [Nocardia terpenica]MBF6107229.1 hypothetical protein [Nocardia terpenica]MBF6114986.1 hypothetical protein [Nocardia terpenica]MBF6122092.1 hypothetical protein [Nocardia terpenica]MBF6154475.1 hypothetical protein [Nocardia terpenica]
MTTISHVRNCQPATMVSFAADLTTQNDAFSARVEQMDRDVDTAMNSWKGEAAAAASVRALSQKLAGNHLSETVVTLADHFNTYGGEMDGYRTALLGIVDGEVPHAGMSVDDDGNVTAPKYLNAKTDVLSLILQAQLDGQAAGFQARIKTLLVQFGDAEGKAAQAITTDLQTLGDYEKTPDGQPVGTQVHAILDGTAQLPTDPQALHDFWETLTPAEKDALYQHDRFLGNHDGIPQVDRDHYNRMTLDQLRAESKHNLDQLQASKPTDHSKEGDWQHQVDAAKTKLAQYDSMANGLATDPHNPNQPPRLLSMLDDQGRGAIAIRNPDTAGNVVTYVPGTGQNLTSINDGIQRSERMRQYAEIADPSKQTSAISWYGYNAPPGLSAATENSYADNAAGPLDGYQSGLRATHDGPRSVDTVVGHSYGTTAIGHAASNGHTLDADKVILVASPGLDVDTPSDLSLTGIKPDDNTNHIWATTNEHDPIKLTPGFIHGPQPWDTPGFGQQFHSEGPAGPWYKLWWNGAAHSSYWDNGNPGLTNMAKIITGVGTVS